MGAMLKNAPPIVHLDLSSVPIRVSDLHIVPMVGASLKSLDLEDCGIGHEHVDALVALVERLPRLEHLDLASNNLDSEAALRLIESLVDKSLNVETLRLANNPLGDLDSLQDAVLDLLLLARDESFD